MEELARRTDGRYCDANGWASASDFTSVGFDGHGRLFIGDFSSAGLRIVVAVPDNGHGGYHVFGADGAWEGFRFLRRHAKEHQRNRRRASSLTDQIVELSFIVPWSGRHLRL